MRSIIVAALAVLGFVSCGACASYPAPKEVDSRTSAERAEAKSVAVIRREHAACGGVWVGRNSILTAFHCIRLEDGPTSEEEAILEALGVEMPKPSMIGKAVAYQSKDGSTYESTVALVDEDNDLALLSASQPPEHDIARVSDRDLHDGEELDVVGSTAGLPFTYSRCYVAATREHFVQVSGPVYLGNSGGGAFDERGDLVGIAHHMIGEEDEGPIANVSFFVPGEVVRKFLAGAS